MISRQNHLEGNYYANDQINESVECFFVNGLVISIDTPAQTHLKSAKQCKIAQKLGTSLCGLV